MIQAVLLSLLLAVPPEIQVDGSVSAEAVAIIEQAWDSIEGRVQVDGLRPPEALRPLRVGTASTLTAGVAAASRPGYIGLRAGLPLTGTGAAALRHEVGHQYLFEACPAALGDRLFHEAFAIAVSGELAEWNRAQEGTYLPLSRALEDLGRSPDLDTPAARRALARLLSDVPSRSGHLPAVLTRRFGACDAGARWLPLRPEDLASDQSPAADALVVLSRHSGEVLVSEGASSLPMPFGSTLKPFMVAGAPGQTPRLVPRSSRPGWRCGDSMPDRMDAATALLRSCNGWFLDWAEAAPGVARLGPWGPVLVALGMASLPADASEAIGIRPSLRLSPLALASAYRLLAEARPDIVDILSRNAREGTLSGLPASNALATLSVKTGTVLDAAANPRLGWIVGIDREVVVVMARAGRTPRTFAGSFADVLSRIRVPGHQVAKVQVFGLVGPSEVRGRCAGRGVLLGAGGPRLLPDAEASLLELASGGPLLCAGGAWLVRLPGAEATRSYAGVFVNDTAPELRSAGPATARERQARRGSDLTFRTHRLAYAAGVVAAEDARSKGEARVALARVADSNVNHSRHRGRPVCDTTHCQLFLGTVTPGKEERRALSAPLQVDRWLGFARGGTEPWRQERSEAAVEAALGPNARALTFGQGRVWFVTSAADGAERWEERRDLPCESLRGPLKLPSCPELATPTSGAVTFEGRGQGHGEGLDVEWASRSGLTAEALIEKAYGEKAYGR